MVRTVEIKSTAYLDCTDILSSIDFQKSTQLSENFVERVTEFESVTTAWKAIVLPTTPYPHGLGSRTRTCDFLLPKQAHYQSVLYRVNLVLLVGLEPTSLSNGF